MSTKPDSADYERPAYLEMRSRWRLCRDIRGGTETMRQAAELYLPRFEAESQKDWQVRVGMTFVYDAFAQAINALVGLALQHGVTLGEDVPERIAADWENIDGQGTHGDVFAQYVLDDALTDGHAGILAEYPVAAPGLTLKQEGELGIRAYLCRIRAEQIINWRTLVYGGRELLSLLVLRMEEDVADGDFGLKSEVRYRVWRQEFRTQDEAGAPIPATPFVTLQTYTELKATGSQAAELVAGPVAVVRGPRFIPFAPVYGGQQEGTLRSRPPLLGLAYSNLDHTQVKSERRYSLHVGSIPWRVITGVDPNDSTPIVVSASEVTKLGPDADAKIVEPTGAANGELLTELREIEKRMAAQALAMLQRDSGPDQTATETRKENAKEQSKLARAVRSLEDALEASLGSMAAYYGAKEEGAGGSVTIRRDFGEFISPEHLQLLAAMRERGDLTLETFLRIVKMASLLPSDVDPKEEAEAVRREMGQEGMGTERDETDPTLMTDAELERLLAERRSRRPEPPGTPPGKREAA